MSLYFATASAQVSAGYVTVDVDADHVVTTTLSDEDLDALLDGAPELFTTDPERFSPPMRGMRAARAPSPPTSE